MSTLIDEVDQINLSFERTSSFRCFLVTHNLNFAILGYTLLYLDQKIKYSF